MRTAALLLSLLCMPLQAALVSDLYTASVAVDGRNNAARASGVKDGLEQVLVRITGNNGVGQTAAGKSIIARADNYLLTYSFQSGEQTNLQVRFDPVKLQQQVRESGLPIWGSQRPVTLHWLAVADELMPLQLVNELADDGEQLNAIAQRRGLPQLLPILDLEDNLAVSANDVLGNFPEPVLRASARYGGDFVLLSSVQQFDGQWHYQMYLYDGQPQQDGAPLPMALAQHRGVVDSRSAALEQVLAATASYYAGRYGAVASDATAGADNQVVFELDGGIDQLVELERYLVSLAPVQQTAVVAVNGNRITLALQLIGGLNEFQQLLSLESRVELLQLSDPLQPPSLLPPEASPVPEQAPSAAANLPHYRWLNQ